MKELFFFKIVIADLLDFATDPEGKNMTVLQFAKEIKKGKSEIEYIQKIINEAHNYREIKRKAGEKGGKAKASSAKAKASSAKAKASSAKANASKSYPETETETETEKNKNRRFTPPEISEVIEYCKERKRGVDPQKWYDFYTAKNWMIGKNKMRDWRAAVRTWEKGGVTSNFKRILE